MGIQGLLTALKPYAESVSIGDYSEQAVAVDTSSWLHKSVYSIADHYVECIERNSNPDARCINVSAKYICSRIEELLVGARLSKIYLVMDGKRCPLKVVTNDDRDQKRAENLRLARNYKAQNRRDQMYEKYKACIKVTDSLTNKVMEKVSQRFQDIQIVWSPYEADAQLAQLCMDGRASAVITEDSDVLVYSASSGVPFDILYKLDRQSGQADKLNLSFLLDSTQRRLPTKDPTQIEAILNILRSRESSKTGWGARLFVQSCVLAGCDYAPRQLHGVGLVTAFKYVRNAGLSGSPSKLTRSFEKILRIDVPKKAKAGINCEEFALLLAQAEAVFYYHPVVHRDGKVIYLNEPSKYSPDLDRFDGTSFIGELLSNANHQSVIPKHILERKQQSPPIRTTHQAFMIHQANDPSEASSLTSPSSTRIDSRRDYHQPAAKLSVSKMTNPYQKRQPLRPTSPNVNVFDRYRLRHAGQEMLEINRIVMAQLPVKRKHDNNDEKLLDQPSKQHRTGGDVRFVKRKFPKDGRLASPPKITLPERLRKPRRDTTTEEELPKRTADHQETRYGRNYSRQLSSPLPKINIPARNTTTNRNCYTAVDDLPIHRKAAGREPPLDLKAPKNDVVTMTSSPIRQLFDYDARGRRTPECLVYEPNGVAFKSSMLQSPNDADEKPYHEDSHYQMNMFASSPNLLGEPHREIAQSPPDSRNDAELMFPTSPNILEDFQPKGGLSISPRLRQSDRQQHHYKRRVTVDAPDDFRMPPETDGPKYNDHDQFQSFFNLYDEAPSPEQNEENIVDLFWIDEQPGCSPYFAHPGKNRSNRTFRFQIGGIVANNQVEAIAHSNPPAERSCIGPAKTLRSRFTKKTAPSKKSSSGGALKKFFKRQKQKRKSPATKKNPRDRGQTSLLSHFRPK